ncbi:DUF4194 domain-containing protein [Roseivirga sp. BDSF3-8]|uniref:DUF4194 domain-containing protein n=1 Tax=Roseivirga sp. BDSF3-8 TaxID=3241598 RepID=UPI0035326449
MDHTNDTLTNTGLQPAPYAQVVARLLKEVLYDEKKDLWETLTLYEVPIREYVSKIGLELVKDEREGYAYLRQMEDDEGQVMVSLITRRSLTYEDSLTCVLLREWLDDFDASADVSSRELYITPKDFRDRVEMFFKESHDQRKFIKNLGRHIKHMDEMGFLKCVNGNFPHEDDYIYQVRRIIKARVTPEQLQYFKEKLEEHA